VVEHDVLVGPPSPTPQQIAQAAQACAQAVQKDDVVVYDPPGQILVGFLFGGAKAVGEIAWGGVQNAGAISLVEGVGTAIGEAVVNDIEVACDAVGAVLQSVADASNDALTASASPPSPPNLADAGTPGGPSAVGDGGSAPGGQVIQDASSSEISASGISSSLSTAGTDDDGPTDSDDGNTDNSPGSSSGITSGSTDDPGGTDDDGSNGSTSSACRGGRKSREGTRAPHSSGRVLSEHPINRRPTDLERLGDVDRPHALRLEFAHP
jgi:hypothetical protein